MKPVRGTSKGDDTSFSDAESEIIEAYAELKGLTYEQAVDELVSDGLAVRVRKKTGRRPSSNVRRFHR